MEANVESMLQQFSMVRKAYAKLCYQTLKQYNFSPNEIDILIFLSNNKTIDTAKELSVYLHISKALVCRSCESLQGRGLLEKHTDMHDKRIQHLRLKDDSEGIIANIQLQKKRFEEQLQQNIKKEDILHLFKTLDVIQQNIIHIVKGELEDESK